jgi:hypothetical protein
VLLELEPDEEEDDDASASERPTQIDDEDEVDGC